jgi:hypothetical protein
MEIDDEKWFRNTWSMERDEKWFRDNVHNGKR